MSGLHFLVSQLLVWCQVAQSPVSNEMNPINDMGGMMNTKRTIEQKGILKNVRAALDRIQPDIDLAIRQMEGNWSNGESRSRQNWRLKLIPLDGESGYLKNPKWERSEVRLERHIAAACAKRLDLWNQMPVASGLLPLPSKDANGKRSVSSEGRRAVDLIYRPEGVNGPVEFLELKVRRRNGSRDSVRDAAFELLEYGALYLFSRKHRTVLGYDKRTKDNSYEVLDAPHVRLRVLAPQDYYWGQDISSISIDAANRALENYIRENGLGNLKMDIGFEQLAKCDDAFSQFVGKECWSGGKGD